MILIVDDKAENIFSLKRLLEINNFQVDTAQSGEEALKKVLKNTYALIILDVQMPDMDGFEVADALSGISKAKDIPIIFLSAVNTDKKFITKGYNSGAIDYIAKPADPDILLLKVKTFSRLFEQTSELNKIQQTLLHEIEVRKKAQMEQQNKTQELQTILESLPQIAFTANAQGEIDYVNGQWYNYSDNKNNFPEVYNKDFTIFSFWKKAIAAREPVSMEVYIKKLNNNIYRYHLLKIIPIKNGDDVLEWIGTFTDIHEQKQLTEVLEQRVEERTIELQKMNEALEISNTDLQQFASVASHDLKEPLRKIQVFISILNNKYENKLDPEIIEYLRKILTSSERMSNLINDLLNFSSLSVATLFKKEDLNTIITEILTDLEIIIKEKQAIINVDPLPPMEIIPGQIRQVFQNLISNALKFTVKGRQPIIHIKSEIIKDKEIDSVADAGGQFCRITIQDNGIGFNEKYLEKIFTIFQRLNSKEEFEGTGIGLAIAKKIIDKHNGIITAKSVEHEGSAFIIILPLTQPDPGKN